MSWYERQVEEDVCTATDGNRYILIQGLYLYHEAVTACALYGGTLANYTDEMKKAVEKVIIM